MNGEYLNKIKQMWSICRIVGSDRQLNYLKDSVIKIIGNRAQYQEVEFATKVPWYVIGAIHFRESDLNFKTHLANGDPLSQKTTHVPKGLGPFETWTEGAIAALKFEGFDHGYHWDIINALDNCERYNGLGYRYHGHVSPYVWSMTDQYETGLYLGDGDYSPIAKDMRPGCAAIIKSIKEIGIPIA